MSDVSLVSETSTEWLAIVALIQARLSDLVEQVMSPTLSDQQRRDLVQRHDELLQLLRAPAETRDLAIRVATAAHTTSTY